MFRLDLHVASHQIAIINFPALGSLTRTGVPRREEEQPFQRWLGSLGLCTSLHSPQTPTGCVSPRIRVASNSDRRLPGNLETGSA